MPRTHRSTYGIAAMLGLVAAAFAPAAVVAQAPASTRVPALQPRADAAPVVQLDLAVEGVASTATGARSAAELAARRVVQVLTTSGIPVQEVRLLDSYLIPEYVDPGVVPITTIRHDRRIAAYRSVTGITVTTADPRYVGLLVDLAQGAGANRVLGVHLPGAAATR
jgi:uncharacterized protein YggE